MSDLVKQITKDLQKKIESFEPKIGIADTGKVLEAGDGIARATGLANVKSQELVQFGNGVMGIAFNLESEAVGIIIMGEYSGIAEGMEVRATGRIASVPVGDGLIGRVVNALGEPVDGKGPIKFTDYRPIERIAAGVVERQDVDTPVQTGIKAIDSMIPIGRGQRELIIGDRQTGKTAIAIDTILNQKGKELICIYVAIGQKKAAVARTVSLLEQHGAMAHTIVVVAAADEIGQPCSTSPHMPAARLAKSSWRPVGMRWSSMMTFPSTPGPTARFPCYCAGRRDGKPTRVTSSTCTHACWSAPPAWPINM